MMELELPRNKRIKLEDKMEFSKAAAPLAVLLLPPTTRLFKSMKMTGESSSMQSMTGKFEALLNWILLIGSDKEIEDIARHHKDFNHFLDLLVDLIYDIQLLCDDLQYDLMRPQIDYLQLIIEKAEVEGHSELRSAIRPMIRLYLLCFSLLKNDMIDFIKRKVPLFLELCLKINAKFPTKLEISDLRIDSIGRKIDEIYSVKNSLPSLEQLLLGGKAYRQKLLCNRETFPDLKDLVVFGRQREKIKIVEWLSTRSKKISTIAIVGQGGLGKTALAQLVFNDNWVSTYFDLRMWIYVSEDLNIENIVRKMIECATGMLNISEDLTSMDYILMSELEGKKILLVLDDVWNEDPKLWESLKAFLFVAEYTRVIVTTRNVSVAEVMQTTDPIRLAYLSQKSSLEILEQSAFRYLSPEKLPNFMEIGELVNKCGGLPLAVKSLATYLRFKHDGDECIVDLPNEVLTETIFPNLEISYNNLSTQLKCCFIYCSMFPECYNFTKDELVSLWISQGYINDRDSKEEDTGNKCFEKLHKSSFFNFSRCNDDAVKIFTIPVFIDALAKHIAGNEFLVLNKLQNITGNVRHLYVGSWELLKCLTVANAMVLRTFVLCSTTSHGLLDFLLGMIRLRALVLVVHSTICELPEMIGNVLKPLRYLRIESSLMENLPESIVNLCHLQVLDLSYCHKLTMLPPETGRLVNLRTLNLSGCTSIQGLPTSVGDLSLLQNLHLVGSSMRWMHPVIRELTNLKRLHYKRTAGYWI